MAVNVVRCAALARALLNVHPPLTKSRTPGQIYELFHKLNHPSSAGRMESIEAFDLSGSVDLRRLSPGGRNDGSLPMRQLLGQVGDWVGWLHKT